jgi:hypothetical protein
MKTENSTKEKEQSLMTEKATKSEEMKNVTLSENTKGFLVAHRMMQEAGDYVTKLMEKDFGPLSDDFFDEKMTPLWEAIGEVQDQIILLMTETINEKLKILDVTEI